MSTVPWQAKTSRGSFQGTQRARGVENGLIWTAVTTSLGARCGGSAQAATGPCAPPEPCGRTASRAGPRHKERWADRGRGSARRPTRPEAVRRHLNAVGRAVSPPWEAGPECPGRPPSLLSDHQQPIHRPTATHVGHSPAKCLPLVLASQTLSAAQTPYTFLASQTLRGSAAQTPSTFLARQTLSAAQTPYTFLARQTLSAAPAPYKQTQPNKPSQTPFTLETNNS
jgi:hypothetical protein